MPLSAPALPPPLADGARVLVVACGTGQCLDVLVTAVGPTGHVVGLDASTGMLAKAKARVEAAGWPNVTLARGDAETFDVSHLRMTSGAEDADAVVCALALTTIDDWEDAFARTFDDLKPGGRYVIFDVHAPQRSLRTRLVERLADADLGREVWRPLEAACPDFARRVLSTDAAFGGTLYLATGTKPRLASA